jgi:hypothetical protein
MSPPGSGQERTKTVEWTMRIEAKISEPSNYALRDHAKKRYQSRQRETIELPPMSKPIRSRSDKAIGDTLEGKWTIVAKRIIAEPTPRTPFDAPRLGIYDYEVVPSETQSRATR